MTKTIRLTNYEPQVSLDEGVRRTYEAYRTRVFEPAAAVSS